MSQSYRYQAIDPSGKESAGEITALSRREALKMMAERQLTVVALESSHRDEELEEKGGRLSEQEIITALYELSAMLNSGVSAAEAVNSQAESAAHPRLRTAFKRMAKTLRHGGSFGQALEAGEFTLPEYVHYLVSAGELTGQVGPALQDACEQMQYALEVRSETRNALIYPAILVFTGVMAVLLMFVYVVPSFTNLLEQADQLPWLAWAVLSAGKWTNENLWLVAGIIVAIIATPVLAWSRPATRIWTMEKLERAPLVGEWLVQMDIASWAKIMSSMMRNRVDLIPALELALASVRAPDRRRRLARARNAVRGGESLSAALESQNCLNPTGYNLVKVGEKSGNLASMLQSLSDIYTRQGRQRMKKVLLMIEPIAILVIGVAIGTLIVAIIMAITSANEIAL